MKLKSRVWMVACLCIVGSAWAQPPSPTLADLAWLVGCWEGGADGSGEESGYKEQWMQPDGQTMLGMSRTSRGDSTLSYEFLRIHVESDGIYYTSIPSGQTQASFKLVKFETQKVVFENPQHDFPQKIIYQLDKNGNLEASIEGQYQGAFQKVDYPMRKAACN